MEISYYYECFSYKGEFVPKCLEADYVLAEFVFGNKEFVEDHNDILSAESKKLLKDIRLLLQKSLGGIDADLSKIRIVKNTKEIRNKEGSVKILVKIKLIRNSVSDIESLLNNNEDACRKFLGEESIDSAGYKCWDKNTKKIFQDKGYEFLSLQFTGSDEAAVLTIPQTSAQTSTNLTTTQSSAFDYSTTIDSRTPKPKTEKSTQLTAETRRTTEKIKTTSSKNKNLITQAVFTNDTTGPTVKQADSLNTSKIMPTTPSTTNNFRTLTPEVTAPASDFSSTSTLVRQEDTSEPNNYEIITSSSLITSLTSTNIDQFYFNETENGAVFETGKPYNNNMRLRFSN